MAEVEKKVIDNFNVAFEKSLGEMEEEAEEDIEMLEEEN